MTRTKYQIRGTQFFDWASEPVDERPSEFASSASSGYGPLPKRRRPSLWARMNVALMAALIVLALGGVALYGLIRLIKH